MISPFIVGPLVGCVIGYITNALAIKMLFRPYTEKRIFGIKIPFTPGIIPKEKGRIAVSLGTAISDNLMSRDVLERNLLSPEMLAKIRAAIDNFVDAQKSNTETLREFLLHFLSEDDIDALLSSTKGELTRQVADRLADSKLGDKIADVVVDHVSKKLRIDGLSDVASGLLSSMLGDKLWSSLADLIQSPARSFLSKNINNMLADRGPEIVNNLLTTQIDDFTAKRVCDLLQGHDAQIQQLTDSIIELYRKLITQQLPRILSTINIPLIIEGRINEMDMRETEQLIFKVMDKELRAIIWLGALLGLLMGFVNAII